VAQVQLQRVRYNHDKVIDLVLSDPWISQREIAGHFGITESWLSVCMNSESFKEALAARKEEIIDPILKAGIEDRLKSVLQLSLEVLDEKLRDQRNGNLAVRVLEHGSRALGYGARPVGPPVQVQTYVAVVPAKALNAQAWVADHAPGALEAPVEAIQITQRVEVNPGGPINEGQTL
jgi:hypothetical protein